MEARDAAWAHLFDVIRKSPQTKSEHVHWKQRLENAAQQVAVEERADAERENARLREELEGWQGQNFWLAEQRVTDQATIERVHAVLNRAAMDDTLLDPLLLAAHVRTALNGGDV